MKEVMQRLETEFDFPLSEAVALELFAREGDWQTISYASSVKTLEAWEINPQFYEGLRRNLPHAKIKITDTWKEIKATSQKYDLIIADAPQGIYGEHCEHFGLLPDIFRIANDGCVIVLNVNAEPYNFHENSEWWRRRKEYYRTEHPEKLELYSVTQRYKEICQENNVTMRWGFFQQRHTKFLYYFVMSVGLQPSKGAKLMRDPLFAVIGDPHIVDLDHEATAQLSEKVQLLNSLSDLKYVLITGDIAHQGKISQFEIAKNIFDTLDSEYFCCAGNHDAADLDAFQSVFGPEQYTSKIGRYNLMVLTWQSHWIDFEINLEENTPTIVLKHDVTQPIRLQNMRKYFKKYNVVCVFQGHYHLQGHEDIVIEGVRYITCPSQHIGVGRLSDPIIYHPIPIEDCTIERIEEKIQ